MFLSLEPWRSVEILISISPPKKGNASLLILWKNLSQFFWEPINQFYEHFLSQSKDKPINLLLLFYEPILLWECSHHQSLPWPHLKTDLGCLSCTPFCACNVLNTWASCRENVHSDMRVHGFGYQIYFAINVIWSSKLGISKKSWKSDQFTVNMLQIRICSIIFSCINLNRDLEYHHGAKVFLFWWMVNQNQGPTSLAPKRWTPRFHRRVPWPCLAQKCPFFYGELLNDFWYFCFVEI